MIRFKNQFKSLVVVLSTLGFVFLAGCNDSDKSQVAKCPEQVPEDTSDAAFKPEKATDLSSGCKDVAFVWIGGMMSKALKSQCEQAGGVFWNGETTHKHCNFEGIRCVCMTDSKEDCFAVACPMPPVAADPQPNSLDEVATNSYVDNVADLRSDTGAVVAEAGSGVNNQGGGSATARINNGSGAPSSRTPANTTAGSAPVGVVPGLTVSSAGVPTDSAGSGSAANGSDSNGANSGGLAATAGEMEDRTLTAGSGFDGTGSGGSGGGGKKDSNGFGSMLAGLMGGANGSAGPNGGGAYGLNFGISTNADDGSLFQIVSRRYNRWDSEINSNGTAAQPALSGPRNGI